MNKVEMPIDKFNFIVGISNETDVVLASLEKSIDKIRMSLINLQIESAHIGKINGKPNAVGVIGDYIKNACDQLLVDTHKMIEDRKQIGEVFKTLVK